MLAIMPLAPLLHGAVGPWDEILNLVPLVVGSVLLLYLYFSKRKGRAAAEAAEHNADTPGPEAAPPAGPEPKPGP